MEHIFYSSTWSLAVKTSSRLKIIVLNKCPMKKLGGGELFWIIYKVKSFMHNANNNQTYFKNLAMFTR